MAATAPSPLASSVEKTNGAKLSRLLIDGGTTVLRNVFDSFHPPANLAATLNANYLALDTLFKKKILHKPQWDLLFPPGGATPDSKTFDISLLFLLLANICGLCPPVSGWHKLPPSSDTSFEANLARVKLYRNQLYGHVTSTGVQTAVFNVKWQEISAVLVALGLNPAEVVRLKSAPCGEDYISAVIEWVKSDEEIKSQLREVLETHQEARQLQEEDHRTLQDTQKAVEEVLKSQHDVHQRQQEARQTQQDNHRTLQDTRQAVQDVRLIHQDTQHVVEEVLKTQQGVQQTQQEVHQTQQEAYGAIQKVIKAQKKNFETLHQVKKTVENMTVRTNEDKEDEILRKLAKIDTQKVIEYHAERYQEGTRLSFFERVEKWLNDRSSPNRVMVISGNVGMGKSVISAVVCKRMQEAGRLSGSHFCQHNKARYRNAKVMLQSLACQLSDSLPQYKNALVKTLSRNLGVELNNMEVKDVFELLFEEPLRKLKGPDRNILMVIDGLDESEYQGRNELLDVIANHFTKLPYWIRFLVTTRPEINIAGTLKNFKPLRLEPNDEENLMDLRLLFEKRLSDVIQQDHRQVIISELVKKSEGLILYAFVIVNFVKENVAFLTPEQLGSIYLPSGISSIYLTYFQRLETELCKELKIKEEQVLTFLSALTAAREPLPLDFVTKMILSGPSSLADRRKVKKVIACISALLPVQDDCIHFFHKSVKDWLTDMPLYGQHDFTVDQKEGHRILSELCTDELDDIKQKSVGSAQFSDTANYALKHGVKHMLQFKEDARACEVVIKKYVVDLEIVYAKLCLSSATAFEDILWIQGHEISEVLCDDSKRTLNSLMVLLRKYVNTFTNHPHLLFQTVLNEGGSVLSPMASNLLQNKCAEIPCMEFVHKQMRQGAVLARFQCSSQVVCFDVSPQLDYMVCECDDGTIQLWSLNTGKLVWVRPVIVMKRFYLDKAYRRSPSSDVLLCYRSVVFHPSEDVVLPGVLSHAYDFGGDLKPLFPKSNCSFTVCSTSGDKRAMLTDCPDDAKCIILWSLKNGSEISRTIRNDDVLSFAWSRDGRQAAISHSTGCICLVDMTDGFKTLAETVSVKAVCGMVKFSPDCRSLFCFGGQYSFIENFFRLNITVTEHSSCTLDVCLESQPWEFESRSEAGFLLGDPLSSVERAFDFVLNKNIVLRGYPFRRNWSCVDMLNIAELRKTERKAARTLIQKVVFSLNGETVYVVNDEAAPTVSAWDVLSGERLGQVTASEDYLLAVKEGVLLTTTRDTLELWNFKLSECIRNWTNLHRIGQMIPISEERVACVVEWTNESKVVVLDTTSQEIVWTGSVGRGDLVACNIKCQLLTVSFFSVELSDGKTTLWKTNLSLPTLPGLFSLDERFVVICAETPNNHEVYVYVLDAVSGEKLHILCKVSWFLDCKFVSDEECVISSQAVSKGYCLRLFNVKSGDLLSVIDLERRVKCLAACPRKRLLAIDKCDSKQGFELIQVQLPQDKDSEKRKRLPTPDATRKYK